MSEFVELDRSFVPVREGKEPILKADRDVGRKYHGWLSWADLLKRPRCVLLAEAGAGKTKELEGRRDRLTAAGGFAFFLRVEDLADDDFEACLSADENLRIREWEHGSEVAHFFLDSVDEARLSGKKLHTALRHLARGLAERAPRAHVLITCRVSDWQWERDLAEFEKALPYRLPPPFEDDLTPEERLLAPLFQEGGAVTKSRATEQPSDEDITVVMLAPLSQADRRPLLDNRKVADANAFEEAISRSGLESFADRPGDVIAMAGWWNEKGRFGTRREMTEYAIRLRLEEHDPHRPNSRRISREHLRSGAERLAAALTLAKGFTLRAPGSDGRPTGDAVDPHDVLSDWDLADVDSLVTRGLFAPATYGRIRFHHRDSQEFLTAAWLERIHGLDAEAVRRLLFVERYGVATVVPSLLPAAAWLAGNRPAIFAELLRRSPISLVKYGDPRAIPIADKERLLRAYAELHARGDIGDDHLDWSAVAMFAVPELHAGIRIIWDLNTRDDFRLDLLRMIREGKVVGALDLARSVVADTSMAQSLRLVAADALDACGNIEGRALLGRLAIDTNAGLNARLAARFALHAFPDFLDVDTLFDVMTRFPREGSRVDGFEYVLPTLWSRCGTDAHRRRFMELLADLCLAEPFVEAWQRISEVHHELAAAARPIVPDAIERYASPPDLDLIRLLMVVERADSRSIYGTNEISNVVDLLSGHRELRRALFWADVEEVRRNHDNDTKITKLWQIGIDFTRFWSVGADDDMWLEQDAINRTEEDDRRLAFDALMNIHVVAPAQWPLWADAVRVRINTHPELLADLDAALAPPPELNEQRLKVQKKASSRKELALREQERDRKAWIDFRDRLCADPGVLRDASLLTDWSGQISLFHLTHWLKAKKTPGQRQGLCSDWQRLTGAFSTAVAEAYRDGMCLVWRRIEPVRPKRDGSRSTCLHSSELARDGLFLEASLSSDWHAHLRDEEIAQAVRHICLGEEPVPEFFDDLVAKHREIALPIIEQALRHEWTSPNQYGASLLSHAAYSGGGLVHLFVAPLLKLLAGIVPGHAGRFGLTIRLLSRAELDPQQRLDLQSILTKDAPELGPWWSDDPTLRIAFLFLVDTDLAVDALVVRLGTLRAEGDSDRAHALLASFFGYPPDDFGIVSNLGGCRTDRLERLVLTAYRSVRQEDDNVHQGAYSPNARDRAERARSLILEELLRRPGYEAWAAVRRLAEASEMKLSSTRFLELARRKADADAELSAWKPSEVQTFEQSRLTPAKTGAELFDLVKSVFAEITYAFSAADFTSKRLLCAARDEEDVQNWLAEQLELRANGRFAVHREPMVARKKKPDIVLTTAEGIAQVAIEIKHGGKDWSGNDLIVALRDQLVGCYLRPSERRHGILVITNHDSTRRWQIPGTGEQVDFRGLLTLLAAEAANSFVNNAEATVVGLDVAELMPQKRNRSTDDRHDLYSH